MKRGFGILDNVPERPIEIGRCTTGQNDRVLSSLVVADENAFTIERVLVVSCQPAHLLRALDFGCEFLRHGRRAIPSLQGRGVNANRVPIGSSAILSESEAADTRTRLYADIGNLHFESSPLSGFGQFAHRMALDGVVAAPADFVGAPIGAVQPVARIPLQHDFLGRIFRIEVDIGEQDIITSHAQVAIGTAYNVLTKSGCREFDRLLAGVHRTFIFADKLPGQFELLVASLRAGGQRIIDPDIVGSIRHGRRRRVYADRVPISRPAELRDGKAVDHRPRQNANVVNFHLQADPLARFGQFAE